MTTERLSVAPPTVPEARLAVATNNNGNLISQKRSSTTSFFLFDALRSPMENLTDIFVQCINEGRFNDCYGNPIGRDFHHAVEIDWLISAHNCDAIVETGAYEGDTTEYLARAYPHLPVWTCEVAESLYRRAKQRRSSLSNVQCQRANSSDFIATTGHFQRPFYFLDAHWDEYWPLGDELSRIQRGVVCIHDFDVGHPACAYDTYQGVACGPELVADYRPIYGNRLDTVYPCPRLPVRRIGRGYLIIGLEDRLAEMPYVRRLL